MYQDKDFQGVLQRFGYTSFKDGQREAIEAALQGRRVLLIQPTGWGKSFVYQAISALKGLTLVFSPLKALMRDQLVKARAAGLRAEFINSDQGEMGSDEQKATHRQILERTARGEVDLLFITPERIDNELWAAYRSRMNVQAVVVDEAHCISMWGHDFRPDYRRIKTILQLLPHSVSLLAVTATATQFVEDDIRKQLGNDVLVMRGGLSRKNLHLQVAQVSSETEKYSTLAAIISQMPGTGVIYAATQGQTESISAYLMDCGLNIPYYHAGLDVSSKEKLELLWMQNKLKALVSTNALGMGVDKPDLRFVVHTEFPGSPLMYYQEIGRVGRDGLPAQVILLFQSTDDDIQTYFIEKAKPRSEEYMRVLEQLRKEPIRQHDLALKTRLPVTKVKSILTELVVQDVVVADKDRYFRLLRPVALDQLNIDRAYQQRLKEKQAMHAFAGHSGCRMQYLAQYLGDHTAVPCGTCDNCTSHKVTWNAARYTEKALEHTQNPKLNLLNVHQGERAVVAAYALDYYGGTKIGQAIREAKYHQKPLPATVLKAFSQMVQSRFPVGSIDAIVFIPPTKTLGFVENIARSLSLETSIPLLPSAISKAKTTVEQKDLPTKELKVKNLQKAFEIKVNLYGKTVLVIDDVCDSGVTLGEVAKLLKRHGAHQVYAATLAKTRHSDQ